MNTPKKETGDRLKRIEGQIRGIQRMLEEGRPCEDIITQLMAARAALDKVGISIITQHVQECARIRPGETGADESKSLERALALFLRLQ
ncbi:MAG: metal-sensitive transcriptional regulator [Dehalococcoidales bacterium]|nr:metal-sensitive transcriptional regulator [Dehalococcoidales bacterium]